MGRHSFLIRTFEGSNPSSSKNFDIKNTKDNEENRIRTYVGFPIDLQSITFNHSVISSIILIKNK
jgi:hypothetical protein